MTPEELKNLHIMVDRLVGLGLRVTRIETRDGPNGLEVAVFHDEEPAPSVPE